MPDPTPDLHLLRGTLDLLLLQALAGEPRHGYAVARWIEDTSRDELRVEDRALYLALHRMEARGWIASSWGTSDNNRRAKFYRLTSKGRSQLTLRASLWTRYAEAVFRVLRAAPA